MKNLQSIISNISHKEQFRRLNALGIINKILLGLPYHVRESMLFSTLKGDTLLVAFKHPASNSEFNNYHAETILHVIEHFKNTHYDSRNELCLVEKVRGYIPRGYLNNLNIGSMRLSNPTTAIEYYIERSSGDFALDENSKFYEIFNNIKEAIKHNESN